MKTVFEWLEKHIDTWYGTFVFGFLVFVEGFFFIPVSTLLAFFSLANRKRALYYAFIATLLSAFGALAGYTIGKILWASGGKSLIYYLISPDKFDQMLDRFKNYQIWTTFIVALMPIPFKLLTISAGFCQLPVIPFILLSTLARGLRFFAISTSIMLWGDKVQYYLNKYFYYIIAATIVFFIALWFVLH